MPYTLFAHFQKGKGVSLDAETRAFVQKAMAAASKPRHLMTTAEAREAFGRITAILAPGPEMARVASLAIPVDGAELPAQLYLPREKPGALLVYLHGGGWVVGGLTAFDPLCRELAAGAGVAIISVEYRKAPEHPFPIPLHDAWQATQWVAARQRELLDTSLPLMVGGDSAGANLAIGTTMLARREGGVRLSGQLLIYPVADCRFDRASYLDPENQLLTDSDVMKWYWQQYAPSVSDRLSGLAAPCREADLSGLPPAIVMTAEHDVLRDEGQEYAERLRQAGVAVQHHCAAGQMHGFLMMNGVLPGSREGLRNICGSLRRLAGDANQQASC